MTWHRVVVVASSAIVVLTLASPSAAQNDGNWMQVTIVNVLPEKLDDYIELQLRDVNPALQRAGVPWRSVWQTAEFGNTYERLLVTPIGRLAYFDSGGPLATGMDPDDRRRLIDRLRRCTVSRQSYAVRYRPDLSVVADNVAGRFLSRVSTIRIAPGRTAEWEDFLRDNLQQFRGAKVAFGVYQRVYGPGPTTWQIIQNHSSFAELTEPGVIGRAFGDQADTVAAQLAGIVQSIERSVLRRDELLSYSSSPPTSGQ